MGKCKNHSTVETAYYCGKYKIYLCDECLNCSDPELYCKYRTSCVIYFLEKENMIKETGSATK